MNNPADNAPFEKEQKIVALIRTLRAAEQELHEVTGGQLDAVASAGGKPYLLREAQEKLLHSESAQRQLAETQIAILNALPAHIAVVDSQGIILSVNEAWRRFATANILQGPQFGVGQNYLEVCERAQGDCADEAQTAASGIRRVLAGQAKEFAIEYPCHSPTEKRWFRLMVTPLYEGQSGGAVVMHVNVTERRLAEETVRESEARYRLLFESNPQPMWVYDLETLQYLAVNRAAIKHYGYSEAEFLGMTIADIRPAEDVPLLREAVARTHDGISYSGVWRHLRKNGQVMLMEISSHPLSFAGHRAQLALMVDITARKQAEREVQHQASFVQLNPNPVLELSADGKVLFFNDACVTMARALGQENVAQVLPPGVPDLVRNCLQTNQPRMRLESALAGRVISWSFFPIQQLQVVHGYAGDITARKQAEQALRESEERFSGAFLLAPVGVALVSPTGRWLKVNRAICQLVGYAEVELMSRTFQDITHPDDLAADLEFVRRMLAGEINTYQMEKRYVHKDGHFITVLLNVSLVHDEQGKPLYFISQIQDITEQVKSKQELIRSNRALQMLSRGNERLIHAESEAELITDICQLAVEPGGYRMAWVGYALSDEDRTIVPMAHAGEERGYLSQIKLSWSEYAPSGRGPSARAIRGGQAVICKDIQDDTAFFTWREAAAERGYRSIICLPLRDDTHAFGVLALYSGEINEPGADELKLLQELADDLAFGICSLRTREQHRLNEQKVIQQAALLNQAKDAIFVRDLENRILFWNKGAEQVYGWTADEAIGKSTRQLMLNESSAFNAAVQGLIKDGAWVGELQKRTKAGLTITVDCRWALMRDAQNRPQSVLCIETDVTEKKKLEAQFLRSQRMEGIGTLAGGIAHDLNNVLAPIMISVQMLKQDCQDADTMKMLDTLEICSKRGANLVKQVLSFARGVDGQRVLIQPAQLVRELQHVLQEIFPKNIDFNFTTTRDLWTVTGDPTQLHQVILNLCVNARDAMPGGGSLKIVMENVVLDETYAAMNPDSRPGAFVMVKVADTGTGIPPEVLDKIFEPFFTTKEIGKGTGLGLSTVLGIVKSHGGFINVYSEPGKGTKFKVYLPATTTPAAAEKVAVAQTQLPRGNGEIVLVVDDEESIRKIVQKTLERFGYRVLQANNGAEAVSLYAQRQNEIALVLTDMMMPIMDGPALIIALKAMNAQVRIIASSGLATNEGIAKAVGAGVRRFVPKPYTTETMLKIIHQELSEPPGDEAKK